MTYPRIYADFHNADEQGRLRLTCVGTIKDLATHGIQLHEGLVLTFYADDADDQGQRDDLLVEGVVSYSPEEQCWAASIDWKAIRHESDERKQDANGVASAEDSPASSKP